MKCDTLPYTRGMELFVLVVLQIGFCGGYRIFDVDDKCSLSESQPFLEIPVGESGPNSSGILRAADNPLHTWKMFPETNFTEFLRQERYLTYHRTVNCSVSLIPPMGYGIVLSIRFLRFKNAYCTDYLQFTSADKNFTECVAGVDDDTESRAYSFAGPVRVTFDIGKWPYPDIHSEFQLTFTAFNHTTSGVCSEGNAFLCNNHNCIWKGLICDKHNNCGDLSDESPSLETHCGYIGTKVQSNVQHFGVFFSLFILILVTCVTFFCCCRNHRTLLYSGTVVHSPLTMASTGSVNYGTQRIMPYNGQQLGAPGLVAANAYNYSMPQPTPYPPCGPAGSTSPMSGVPAFPQPAPYPSLDVSGRPPSPPPPYTQKCSP